jgi:ABC-2 type transport system ATP-binding protein
MLYTQSFYPKWDETYAEELRAMFDLDPKAKIKTLSRGQRAQAGLLAALSHRPDLLLLDEPSSGLDPVVRRDILTAIIRTVAEEGRTILFSSHLLDEVERVADHVAMIHKGKVVMSAPLDEIKAQHHRVTLRFAESRTAPPEFPDALFWEGSGQEWTAVCDGRLDELKQHAAAVNATVVEEGVPSLEEMFIARVKAKREV